MPLRCLVTGGAGFIGSHVVDALVEAGHQVLALDNLATGKRAQLNPAASFVEADLRDADLDALLADFRPEVVLHQAAQASVPASVHDPLDDASVNVVGTLRLLEAARKSGVRKVIYAATGGAMYGAPRYLPIDERHPVEPLSPYAVSKTAAGHYLRVYQSLYGLAYTSLRYANIYGPRQDPHGEAGVIAIFTNRMLAGEQPIVHGAGTDQRDYVFVGDVARANLLALRRADNAAVNIGTGVGTDVNTLFDRLKALTEFEGERVHGPPRAGDVPSMRLDPSLSGQLLGWTAEVPLADGLRRTVESFLSRAG
jgi:UDP-glucose 4-epimerase